MRPLGGLILSNQPGLAQCLETDARGLRELETLEPKKPCAWPD